ncbi:SpoVR family protein [Asaia prunellae]|nr:SpoVR family protein [Asaia prunellae]
MVRLIAQYFYPQPQAKLMNELRHLGAQFHHAPSA